MAITADQNPSKIHSLSKVVFFLKTPCPFYEILHVMFHLQPITHLRAVQEVYGEKEDSAMCNRLVYPANHKPEGNSARAIAEHY